jgi:opacity protein-like surface antigen
MKKMLFPSLRSRGAGLGLALAATLAAGAVQAQTSPQGDAGAFYAEIGYTGLTYKNPNVKTHPADVRLIGGYEAHPNMAVEFIGLLSARESTVTGDSGPIKLKVDSVWGLFLKPKVAVSPEVELFGRLGYARTKIKLSADQGTVSDSGDSFAYGVGAAYAINKRVSLNLDYMSYYDRDHVRVQGPTLGLGIKF